MRSSPGDAGEVRPLERLRINIVYAWQPAYHETNRCWFLPIAQSRQLRGLKPKPVALNEYGAIPITPALARMDAP
ncbi:MAG: hypothetical protein HZC29_02360 [Thaumarchaeota archaeon]|nr:hypothetical protein [Nitrososphaerota archaeon]